MPVTGRPREFDRDVALEAAMHLFWRKGFAATSMNDLYEAMGIRSPSLYAAFGSKEALYREAFQHYIATLGPRMWDRLDNSVTARTGIENLLMAAAPECLQSANSPSGCMAMLGAVCDEWPASITEDVREARFGSLERIRRRLEAAVAEGELAPSTDIDRLSRFYICVFQGMSIQARDGATAAQLKCIAEAAMAAWPDAASSTKPDKETSVAIELYDATIPVFVRMMGNLATVLEKAEAWCAETGTDAARLTEARLAPDMLAMNRQIHIASDVAKGAISRLAGIESPRYSDTETSFTELKQRLAKTIEFVSAVKPEQVNGNEGRIIEVKFGQRVLTLTATEFVFNLAMPNFMFHVVTAYDLLRAQSVPLGKADYLFGAALLA